LLDFDIGYQNHEQARSDFTEAVRDATWVQEKAAPVGPLDEATLKTLESSPDLAPRIDRYRRGQRRLRAVAATQARLECEGLLSSARGYTSGAFDVATNQALAEFERKNDIFGWGFLSPETRATLVRSPLDLHFDTFRRILAERVSDAAGILEDGSVSK